MGDPLRQPMTTATRLENGTVLETEQDHARAAAAAELAADSSETTETPAESGAGEEIESDAS